jgi:Leucine-rich repeat (LRR) protein
LTDTVPDPINMCFTLHTLNVSGNRLQSITGIGSLTNLKSLDVSGNRLDYLPEDMIFCSRLVEFKCNQNRLTCRSFPANFNELSALIYLNISDNKIEV